MNRGRREALRSGGGVTLLALITAAGWLPPRAAHAQGWNKSAFDAPSLKEAMQALGSASPAQSSDIAFSRRPKSPRTARSSPLASAAACQRPTRSPS